MTLDSTRFSPSPPPAGVAPSTAADRAPAALASRTGEAQASPLGGAPGTPGCGRARAFPALGIGRGQARVPSKSAGKAGALSLGATREMLQRAWPPPLLSPLARGSCPSPT